MLAACDGIKANAKAFRRRPEKDTASKTRLKERPALSNSRRFVTVMPQDLGPASASQSERPEFSACEIVKIGEREVRVKGESNSMHLESQKLQAESAMDGQARDHRRAAPYTSSSPNSADKNRLPADKQERNNTETRRTRREHVPDLQESSWQGDIRQLTKGPPCDPVPNHRGRSVE